MWNEELFKLKKNQNRTQTTQNLLKIMRRGNIFSPYCLEAQDQMQALRIFNTAYKQIAQAKTKHQT